MIRLEITFLLINKNRLFDVLFHKIKSYLSLIFSEVYAFSILNTLGFIQEKNSASVNAEINLKPVPAARHSKAPSSFHYAVTSQGEASARPLGKRHRTTLIKTGIDGYGVPVRNGIFANAMISRDRHCHHDAACFSRNAVNAEAVIMRVQGTYTQGYAALTLGCLTLAAP